jgi:transcriptional regulator with XRE-family HTH domain
MARPPKPIDPDRSALHWLGHELRRWRTRRGLSQKSLGSQIGFSRVYISLVETAQERPAQEFVERCDHALEAQGRLLAIYRHVRAEQAGAHLDVPALRAQTPGEHGASEGKDDMPAGAVTEGAPWAGEPGSVSALHVLGGTSTAIPSRLPSPIPPMVAMADVVVIRDMLRVLTTSDRQFGGAHAREYATDYLGNLVLPRLATHHDPRVRRDLFAVSTEFALRVASMHLDAGDASMSRRFLGTAGSLAQETDDLTLAAWVLARRGEQEIHERHIDRALAFTGGAAAMARQAAPGARAFILTKYALTLSMTGARKETQRVLGEVWDAYDKLGSATEPEWMDAYGWGHLRHEEGRCYYWLGMGREAARAAEASMQVRSRDRFARPRAFSLGVQAIGCAQAKEVDKACAVGQELVAVAGRLASDRVRIRVVEVVDALRPYRSVAAVRDLYEAAGPVLRGDTTH